jgi:hypothetical protein
MHMCRGKYKIKILSSTELPFRISVFQNESYDQLMDRIINTHSIYKKITATYLNSMFSGIFGIYTVIICTVKKHKMDYKS